MNIKRLKFSLKRALIASLTFAGVYLTCSVVKNEAINSASRAAHRYVISNLEQRLREQENKLGIKYCSIPYLVLEDAPVIIAANDGIKICAGIYNPPTDTLFLLTYLKRTPEFNATNLIAELFTFGFVEDINRTLDHELGHFYIDKLFESKGIFVEGYYPNEESLAAAKLINEGICEYFKKKMGNNMEDNFKEEDWPTNIFGFREKEVIYAGGFHLVKPILERYGKAGIEYLVFNLPSREELYDLLSYQKKIMQELEALGRDAKH